MTLVHAPLGAIDTMRRPLRPGHVLVTLEDQIIVTWRAGEAALRRHLPHTLTPVVRGGDAFVSAVLFRNRALRPAVPGIPRLGSRQMNVRSYVLDPTTGEPGSVFFHGLYVSRRWLARVSSRLFDVAFEYRPFTIEARHDGARLVDWHARSRDGRVDVAAHAGDFAIDEPTLDLLTNAHTGYVRDARGTLRVWSIWHRPQTIHTAVVDHATVTDLPALDLGAPESALYVRSVDYEIYLPARVVA
jgi:uncharacterized protein YqjF (DUF2071 family)